MVFIPREIIVVPYDAAWPERYEKEKAILQGILDGLILDIQHFGSTSIPGMSAKPIIDIMVVVEDISRIDAYNEAMERSGYSVRGENGIPGRRYFVRLHPDGSGNHTHHIHVYQRGNPHIADELMFRDYLSVDADAFREYEAVKLKAAALHRHSPGEYVDAKYDCVTGIMEKAKRYYTK